MSATINSGQASQELSPFIPIEPEHVVETPVEIRIPTAAEGQVFVTHPDSLCYRVCPDLPKTIGKIATETDPATTRALTEYTARAHESCGEKPDITEFKIFGFVVALRVKCGANPYIVDSKTISDNL